MAHFAEIDATNTVTRVVVVPDEQEHRGEEFLAVELGLGGRWVQTSYNTFAGKHRLGGTPLRKNYAGKGYTYDEQRDAFVPLKRFPSWVLDEETCQWKCPVPRPTTPAAEGMRWTWDEPSVSWIQVPRTP